MGGTEAHEFGFDHLPSGGSGDPSRALDGWHGDGCQPLASLNSAHDDSNQPREALLIKGAVMRRVLVPTDFSEAALLVTREAMS